LLFTKNNKQEIINININSYRNSNSLKKNLNDIKKGKSVLQKSLESSYVSNIKSHKLLTNHDDEPNKSNYSLLIL